MAFITNTFIVGRLLKFGNGKFAELRRRFWFATLRGKSSGNLIFNSRELLIARLKIHYSELFTGEDSFLYKITLSRFIFNSKNAFIRRGAL